MEGSLSSIALYISAWDCQLHVPDPAMTKERKPCCKNLRMLLLTFSSSRGEISWAPSNSKPPA